MMDESWEGVCFSRYKNDIGHRICEGGKEMLDEKRMVKLGGFPQKIHIRTQDETKPVLLFLHGGPGVCNRHGILQGHSDLMDTFTLVAWDQRGSGGSFWGAQTGDLTVKRLTDDGAELVQWLCQRFHKDKVFIIGGSWGSLLGAMMASRYPEHIAAFVGFGQFVDGAQNETLSYRFALQAAREAGDRKSEEALIQLGEPIGGCYAGGYKGMMIQRNIMMKYGGYSKNPEKRSYFSSMVKPMLLSGEYTLGDLIGLAIGHRRVLETMWPEVGGTNLNTSCRCFQVPVFIFDGRLDNNTPAALVEGYFQNIQAPRKELVWFEHSGHNPMNDEPERFKSLLRQRLTEIKENEEAAL